MDGRVIGEIIYKKTANGVKWSHGMRYIYGDDGSVIGFGIWDANTQNEWERYYFIKNVQGDVLHVYREADNTLVASYEYDPFGKVSVTYSDGDMANENPFRYHGYYYDNETGFYYASSRYYDPATCRWISADRAIPGTGGDILGYNMFAYCFNNPVNMSDPSGNWPKWLETTVKVVSAVVTVVAVVATVAAVSVFTAGTGSAAAVYGATILLGAALSGLNGGVANEAKGNSYTNGYVGGATGGAIQAACSKTPGGTIIGGGFGATVGTAVTDAMNNWDPDSTNSTAQEIATDAITSGKKALVGGEEIICTPSHPFYSPVKGWTDAVHLRAGDILVLVNGEYVVVEKIQHEILEAPVTVYNFQVQDYHTYYVAESGVLVHNRCAVPKKSVAMETGDALSTAEDYLGPGYYEAGRNTGRFVSADGMRQVRMGYSDITGAHAGGPHINLDWIGPGKYDTFHIFTL